MRSFCLLHDICSNLKWIWWMEYLANNEKFKTIKSALQRWNKTTSYPFTAATAKSGSSLKSLKASKCPGNGTVQKVSICWSIIVLHNSHKDPLDLQNQKEKWLATNQSCKLFHQPQGFWLSEEFFFFASENGKELLVRQIDRSSKLITSFTICKVWDCILF